MANLNENQCKIMITMINLNQIKVVSRIHDCAKIEEAALVFIFMQNTSTKIAQPYFDNKIPMYG